MTETKYDMFGLSTLRQLDLGAEIPLVQAYMQGEFYDDTDPQNNLATQLRAQMESQLESTEGTEYFPNVDQISLRGLDCPSLFIGPYQDRMFNFRALTSLTLESSCSNFEEALASLGSLQLLGLQFLHIRQEGVHPDSLPSLTTFLCTLPPLTTLFVLLECNIANEDFDLREAFQKHGKALQRLIFDVRCGNRETTAEDSTIWQPQTIKDICENCPNLVELGMPFQLTTENDSVESRKRIVECIKFYFPRLRTLNIRNLPSINEMVSFMTVDEFVKAFATTFVQTSINAHKVGRFGKYQIIKAAGVPSSLTTIALGALKYRDVWDGTEVDRGSTADDYLMLRTYSIDYRRNAEGQHAPLLKLRAKGPTSHIKPSCSDISILEPYWLA